MKTFTLALCLLIGLATFAQKSSVLVYGTVGASRSWNSDNDNRGTSFSFNPGIGYQWNDHWTGGVELGLGRNVSKGNGYKGVATTYSVAPFLRYTHRFANGPFFVYAQGSLGYLRQRVHSTMPGSTVSRYNNYSIGVTPGIGIELNKGWALNFNVGNLGYVWGGGTGITGNSNFLGFGAGAGSGFGISKNFLYRKR